MPNSLPSGRRTVGEHFWIFPGENRHKHNPVLSPFLKSTFRYFFWQFQSIILLILYDGNHTNKCAETGTIFLLLIAVTTSESGVKWLTSGHLTQGSFHLSGREGKTNKSGKENVGSFHLVISLFFVIIILWKEEGKGLQGWRGGEEMRFLWIPNAAAAMIINPYSENREQEKRVNIKDFRKEKTKVRERKSIYINTFCFTVRIWFLLLSVETPTDFKCQK